jgi:hypothetical protein
MLARRFSHDPRRKDPIGSIAVIDESGCEIHREKVDPPDDPRADFSLGRIG